ncbi:MAG: Gfo/Idh/MocA family oxidoreductase [Planctomycetes bacterium]|nr:Gfo/Idh/MocA family oxidoreductase [Planctomycetota bacterium]
MGTVVNVGIIGLGRRWRQRYRPALLGLPEHYRLSAVCDPVRHRAIQEARRLGCQAAAGPAALLERPDIDAVLLLDAPWYRLWPVELACGAGKPIFCACPLELDEAQVETLLGKVRDRRLPVLVVMVPRFAPVLRELRELLQHHLGSPRLVLAESVQPSRWPTGETPSQSVLAPLPGLPLLDWCVGLLGTEPASVLAAGNPEVDFSSLFLECGPGSAVQITKRRAPGARRFLGFKVVTERGLATAVWPDRLRWTGSDGTHIHILRGQPPVGRLLLEHFYQGVTAGEPLQPNLEDAYRVFTWWRAARRSLTEGRRVSLKV